MSRRRGMMESEPELPHEVRKAELEATRTKGRSREEFGVGQRWASEMEPELGLGTIVEVEHRRVKIAFQNGESIRQYALPGAPLKRIRFRVGDVIQSRDGKSVTVVAIAENNNVITYQTSGGDLPEAQLSDRLRFTAPLDRLMAGDHDSLQASRLRSRALELRSSSDRSPVKGLSGARIELIPHQLYIAQEVSSRHVRRVLLADEVGLGKTIEACLIMHRLLVTGRARRALIAVPESMIHVWFVELIRKFNLVFRICNREYFDSLRKEKPEGNPFLDEQLVLTCIDYFAKADEIRNKMIEAGWDILVVDEAHHFREATAEFACIEALAAGSRDVFLLTATPSQFGERNHFARLRLLDPQRYTDYEAFLKEAEAHRAIAQVTGRLLEEESLSAADIEALRRVFQDAARIFDSHVQSLRSDPANARREIVAEILDRHGIGRAVFRNTRASVGGFPSRAVHLVLLEGTPEQRNAIGAEYQADRCATPAQHSFHGDLRVMFVVDLVRRLPDDKILLICTTKEKVTALEQAIKREVNVNTAVFHEDLSLIQRDRNAAYFAEEDGARLLLCSEIGSEGRNFQFSHHLVLFDLPANPELIEQRIGRLDRIGQKHTVEIHVPFVQGTPYALLARWHHEGVNVFAHTAPAAAEVYDALGLELDALVCGQGAEKVKFDEFVNKTRLLTGQITERLSSGRDRLLEQHSFRPHEAQAMVGAVRESDSREALDSFMIDLFRSSGMVVESMGPRTYRLWSEASLDETFPGLRGARPVVTFDRATALRREDYDFITPDHPAVLGGMDLLLGSQQGNCALTQLPPGSDALLFMEAVFVVEAIAPPELNAGRFLPPTPVRIVLDHRLREQVDMRYGSYEGELQPWDGLPVLERPNVKMQLLPHMQRKASELAKQPAGECIRGALGELERRLGGEVARLKALRSINPAISEEEILRAQDEADRLKEIIASATPRLDALRLIWRPAKA